MKHLQSFLLSRGRHVACGQKLVAYTTSLFVLFGASTALAQYGYNPYAQPRQASHYGNPSTVTGYGAASPGYGAVNPDYGAAGYGATGYGTSAPQYGAAPAAQYRSARAGQYRGPTIQYGNSRPMGYGPVAQNQRGSIAQQSRGASFYDPTIPPDPAPLPSPMPTPMPQSDGSYSDQIWSGGGCSDGSYDIGCDPCGCNPWYVGVYALTMTRDQANRVWTSFETGNNPNQLTHTQDVDADWGVGGEIVIGRCLPCFCGWGIEARYWQIDDMNAYASTTHANSVSTPLDVSGIQFGATGAGAYFDGADEHRLWRTNEFYNFEVNMVNNARAANCGGCSGWQVGGLFGFRYMRFDENLRFGSLSSGGAWGTAVDAAYLEDNIENQLYGFQAGANIRRQFCRNWAFTCTPKVGIFGNHIENRFHAYRGDGLAATPTGASGVTGTYPVDGTSDSLSFMLEMDFGLAWQISSRWEATVGYRVLALTGMGLADNQFAPFVVDIPELADVDINGSLVLHGGYAGVTYRF